MPQPTWVRFYSGVPPVSAFSGPYGSPVVIDRTTGYAYYLDPVTNTVVQIATPGGGGFPAPVIRSADWTVGTSDNRGLSIHPASDTTGRLCTIPSNGAVPLPVGFNCEIYNDTGAGAVTIAITTDTLVYEGTTSVGTRTLVGPGSCYLKKIDITRWSIVGTNLT